MKQHDVYWGTHGCDKKPGHRFACKCNCGMKLRADHQHVFGDDMDTAIRSCIKVLK